MEFEIRSYESAGPIRFGMLPSEVRAALGAAFKSFKKSPQCEHPCDSFPELDCFVYYDASGRTEAIEFASPAHPTLDSVNLLAISFVTLVEQLSAKDAHLSIESDGLTSLELGIGAYAPEAEDTPSAPSESVIVFARDYYDS